MDVFISAAKEDKDDREELILSDILLAAIALIEKLNQ